MHRFYAVLPPPGKRHLGLLLFHQALRTPALSQYDTLSSNLCSRGLFQQVTQKHTIRIRIICRSCLNKKVNGGREGKESSVLLIVASEVIGHRSEACILSSV